MPETQIAVIQNTLAGGRNYKVDKDISILKPNSKGRIRIPHCYISVVELHTSPPMISLTFISE